MASFKWFVLAFFMASMINVGLAARQLQQLPSLPVPLPTVPGVGVPLPPLPNVPLPPLPVPIPGSLPQLPPLPTVPIPPLAKTSPWKCCSLYSLMMHINCLDLMWWCCPVPLILYHRGIDNRLLAICFIPCFYLTLVRFLLFIYFLMFFLVFLVSRHYWEFSVLVVSCFGTIRKPQFGLIYIMLNAVNHCNIFMVVFFFFVCIFLFNLILLPAYLSVLEFTGWTTFSGLTILFLHLNDQFTCTSTDSKYVPIFNQDE